MHLCFFIFKLHNELALNNTCGRSKKMKKINNIHSHVSCQRHISEFVKSDRPGFISEESLFIKTESKRNVLQEAKPKCLILLGVNHY